MEKIIIFEKIANQTKNKKYVDINKDINNGNFLESNILLYGLGIYRLERTSGNRPSKAFEIFNV